MKTIKSFSRYLIIGALALVLLAGCTTKKESKNTTLKEDNKILVGVSAVPHEEIIEALKDDFKAAGLDVSVKVFSDYPLFNTALSQGEIDANYFQHEPYFKDFCASHKLDLVNIGFVHLEPMGFYSKKVTSLDALPENGEILIPNDDTNCGRALLLLQQNGLIELKDKTALNQTEKDIVKNDKNLKFTPVDAAAIAKSYQDVDGAVINSNYAINEGLNPVKDAIVIESTKDNPYANLVAVRKGEEKSEKFVAFMKVLHSEKCKKFIEEKYKGAVIPAFGQ